jgi:hypothetical protein
MPFAHQAFLVLDGPLLNVHSQHQKYEDSQGGSPPQNKRWVSSTKALVRVLHACLVPHLIASVSSGFRWMKLVRPVKLASKDSVE